MAAAAMPASSWATMYMSARSGAIRRVTRNPIVTAGLKWPPEMCPSAVTAIASASPFARATSSRLGSPAIVTDTPAPIPMKKKKNAPMNSATDRRTASSGSSQSMPPMRRPPPSPASSISSTTTTASTGSLAGAWGSSTAREHKGFAEGLSLPSGRSPCQDPSMAAEPVSDGDLVARCRAGDQTAWTELVERYSRYVYGIAIQGFRLPDSDAEDVFQDVFMRAYEHLDSLRDDEALRPWLAQLTRRLCIDAIRARSRERATEELEDGLADEERIGALDDALAIHQAMGELPENCRDILDRFFARDESYRTIGDALELPAGTIASRISRCLVKLREVYEGRNPVASASGGT